MTPEETIKAIVASQNVSLNIMALIENACGIEFDNQGIAAQIIQTNIQDYAEQYHKDQSKWIDVKKSTPDEGVPVWAIEENHTTPVIMTYEYMPNEDGEHYWVWCKCYCNPYWIKSKQKWDVDQSDWDDDYNVAKWQLLPEPPKE